MSTTTISAHQTIEKEVIATLSFPKEDVLQTSAEQAERRQKLKRATKLGNLEKHKVAIDFEDAKGPKRVETTIWSITEKYIILKYNNRIPINRITNIKLL